MYTFWVIMACTWILFFILLHRFSLRRGIIKPIFNDIVPFTLAIFFFSRTFHIASDWLNEKFIFMELLSGNIFSFLHLFFIPQRYTFSLFGAFFGFIVIFFIKTHAQKKDRSRYIDAIMYAFLFSSLLWYIAALFGGQIYGTPFSSPISITYTHVDSIVKDRASLFPLAIFYLFATIGIILSLLRFERKNILPHGFIGYVGMGAYGILLFFWEFLSGGRKDIFYDYFSLGINQIGAIICILIAISWILRLIQKRV